MVKRFLALVPEVAYMLVFRSACLLVSALLNIGFVYFCIALLTPLLRSFTPAEQSLLTPVISASYVLTLIGIIVIQYVAVHRSIILREEIATRVSTVLHTKLCSAMISSRSSRCDTTISQPYNGKEDIAWLSRWASCVLPNIFAAIPIPFVISSLLCPLNICVGLLVLVVACCSLIVLLDMLIGFKRCYRYLALVFGSIAAISALVILIVQTSIRGAGLASSVLMIMLMMIGVLPLRRVICRARINLRAKQCFAGIYQRVSLVESDIRTIDASRYELPVDASNIVFHVHARYSDGENDAIRQGVSEHYASFVALPGKLQLLDAQYLPWFRSALFEHSAGAQQGDDYTLLSYRSRNIRQCTTVNSVISEEIREQANTSCCLLNNMRPALFADVVTLIRLQGSYWQETVRDNLLMADPHATTSMMWQALRVVGLSGIVYSDERGLDMRLEDISQEDKRLQVQQRLMIARAYLRDTPVYIADYATLEDTRLLRELLNILRYIAKQSTVLVILPDSYQTDPEDTKITVRTYYLACDHDTLPLIVEQQASQTPSHQPIVADMNSENVDKQLVASRFTKIGVCLTVAASTILTTLGVITIPAIVLMSMAARSGKPVAGCNLLISVISLVVCVALSCLGFFMAHRVLARRTLNARLARVTETISMICCMIALLMPVGFCQPELVILAIVTVLLMVILLQYMRSSHVRALHHRMYRAHVRFEQRITLIAQGIDDVIMLRQATRCIQQITERAQRLAQLRTRWTRKFARVQAGVVVLAMMAVSSSAMLVTQLHHSNHMMPADNRTVTTIIVVLLTSMILVELVRYIFDNAELWLKEYDEQ